MHVCIAMLLDTEKTQICIVEALCKLLILIGELLDRSSPASRNTMDEYFTVLKGTLKEENLPSRSSFLIQEVNLVDSYRLNFKIYDLFYFYRRLDYEVVDGFKRELVVLH